MMHSRVLLAMKDKSGVLTSREEMDEKSLFDFIDDLQISNGNRLPPRRMLARVVAMGNWANVLSYSSQSNTIAVPVITVVVMSPGESAPSIDICGLDFDEVSFLHFLV